MKQYIANVSLVVKDYDEAIAFYTKKLHFDLIEDTIEHERKKRWVVIAPPGATEARIVLGRAANSNQQDFIGNQTGGRVFLSIHTDNFWRDYDEMLAKGIEFVREPESKAYGHVAVFKDLYGNLIDLIQYEEDRDN